jgi:purine-binding chemotaxis protein CheW
MDSFTAPAEYLTLRLGGETYGIDILQVQEIREWEAPTTLANAPEYILGVINLRGVIVPIVDLRIRFGLAAAAGEDCAVVIVLNFSDRVVGAVVDAVCDVLRLPAEEIKPTPRFASTVFDAQFITGLVSAGDDMIVLLDVRRVVMTSALGLEDEAPA